MSKQTIHEGNSWISIIKTWSDLSSSLPRKYKVLLASIGALAAVTVYAAVIAGVVTIGTSQMFLSNIQQQLGKAEPQGDPQIDIAKREELLKQV